MERSAKPARLSIRTTPDLERRLRAHSAATGKSESVIVRQALEEHLAHAVPPETALDCARRLGLVGCAKDLPADLSTNAGYFEGFGKARTRRGK